MIWEYLKTTRLESTCDGLWHVFDKLNKKWRKRPDGELKFRMEWHEHLKIIAYKLSAGHDIVHMRIMFNTIGKYALQYRQLHWEKL